MSLKYNLAIWFLWTLNVIKTWTINSKGIFNTVIHGWPDKLKFSFKSGFFMRRHFSALLPWIPALRWSWWSGTSHVITNYGSYGTVPVVVQKRQFQLLRELENCPERFFRVTLSQLYEESRLKVSNALSCSPKHLAFIESITEGIRKTITSLIRHFEPGDAILCMRNVGYGAVLEVVDELARENNLKVIDMNIEFPIVSVDQVCVRMEQLLASHPNIKLAVFDHVTSSTALLLPVCKMTSLCRKYDVISLVDGAHGPGQLEIDLEEMGVDIYFGNMHKWYYTPKSCTVFFTRPAMRQKITPNFFAGELHQRFWREGTKNYTAMLVVGEAVEFMQRLGGIKQLHAHITPLVEWAADLYAREWKTSELSTPSEMKAPYMRVVFLPDVFTQTYGTTYQAADTLMLEFLHDEKVAMFIIPVAGRLATRVSAQIFSARREYKYACAVVKRKAQELILKVG